MPVLDGNRLRIAITGTWTTSAQSGDLSRAGGSSYTPPPNPYRCATDPVAGTAGQATQEQVIDGVLMRAYRFSCLELPGEGNIYTWLPVITGHDLALMVYESATAQIPAPATEILNLDPEFGWTYVREPTEFRVTNLQPVSASVTASAGPLVLWATVTATPTGITFDPGEPNGGGFTCSLDDNATPYNADHPSACSYTYRNSSAIAADGRTFMTSTSVEWHITYDSFDGGGDLGTYTSTSSLALGVAEIQALVSCVGHEPEQGGC